MEKARRYDEPFKLSAIHKPQLEHRAFKAPHQLPLTDARGGSPLKRRPFALLPV